MTTNGYCVHIYYPDTGKIEEGCSLVLVPKKKYETLEEVSFSSKIGSTDEKDRLHFKWRIAGNHNWGPNPEWYGEASKEPLIYAYAHLSKEKCGYYRESSFGMRNGQWVQLTGWVPGRKGKKNGA